MESTIKACHLNITSIRKHKDELLARFAHCHILSINESNLKHQSHFSLQGFNIFRNDRTNKAGGGVLLAFKEHLKTTEILNTTIEGNEIVAVQLESTTIKSFLVASVYVPPPTAKISLDAIKELYNLNNNCLILGDFNAALQQMGSRKTNAKGHQLLELLNEGFLHCIDNDLTTFERNNYEEKIDWILTSQPLFTHIRKVEVHPPMGMASGHKPLTMELSMEADHRPKSPRTSLNFQVANWPLYRRQVNENLAKWTIQPMNETSRQIEEYAAFLTNCITTATEAAAPKARQSLASFQPTDRTKKLIQLKHQAYRRWKRNNTVSNKKDFYVSKALFSNALRNEKISNFNKLMNSLSSKKMYSASVWTTIREFHNKRTKQMYPDTLSYKNLPSKTDEEKANLFAEYYDKEVFRPSSDKQPFHHQVTNEVAEIKKRILNRKGPKPSPISEREVRLLIKQLTNSSTEPDGIHNRCLKNFTKSLISHLTALFNLIICTGYIPQQWKRANIILILKPHKDKHQPSSYRPISLLSCLGKLLEKIIKKRLMEELERRRILPAHQAGFRPHKSSMYNAIRLERYANQALGERRQAAVIFFDIKAAFDSVWHEGLIYKINDLKLPEYLLRYIVSFLNNRTGCIEIENVLSAPFILQSGTPQGSPLSPLLYILYTSDSMTNIPNHTEYGLFADDTALWTSSNTTTNLSNRLQKSITEFQKWCTAWKLRLQPLKTELIHFSPHPRKKNKNPLKIEVEAVPVEPRDSARYLGIIFDRKLDWRTHVKKIESKAAARIGLLRYLTRANQNPNEKIMLNIYKSLVRSILTNGFSILLTAKEKVWERLQITQNKALRAALGAPPYTSARYIHNTTRIPEIKEHAKRLLEKSIARAQEQNDKKFEKSLREIQLKIASS